MLSLGGASQDPQTIRLGMSNLFVESFLEISAREKFNDPIQLSCDQSMELSKGLVDGYVDAACMVNPPDAVSCVLLAQWQEPIIWVRGANFMLSPGAPIPLVGWPAFTADQIAFQALENKGLVYRLVFSSYDTNARIAAVAAGLGVMAWPARKVPNSVTIAREYYLPPLPSIPAGICTRIGADPAEIASLIALLMRITPPESPQSKPDPKAAKPARA
jgi:DNA-binding transcriptional LysR family regulator